MKAVIAFLLMMVPALAAPVPDSFSDPAMEARARNLQRQLRCLVCQGESIDESGSPFAADVRHLVRRQMAEGKTDRQIEDFLVARYGNFILMRPPLEPDTWLLWLGPFLVLCVAGTVAWVTVKKAAHKGA
ncbi:MAG TPA: cytochrome c-type biogenesis protein [Rhizomicrobium sp.]|jgi:cytochrome c-type biogenesis protein CcmH|nr:cytochrome c-type biogenesis protein [Rhizomicrobium sp.]